MQHEYPIDNKMLCKRNFTKYNGVPPSWELIENTIKKSGLRMLVKFERVWKIPEGSLTLYKISERILPIKYWHIFYEYDKLILQNGRPHKRRFLHQKKTTTLTTNNSTISDIKQQLQPTG